MTDVDKVSKGGRNMLVLYYVERKEYAFDMLRGRNWLMIC